MSNEKLEQSTKFSGNILLFYAFDIGDDIDLEKIKDKKLLEIKDVPISPYFKDYHKPLLFSFKETETSFNGASCITSKIHHFGVLSFCYKVPYKASFEELKHKVIDIKNDFDVKSKADAQNVYKTILPTIKKPIFYNLDNFYFSVQIDPLKELATPEEFKKFYGSRIASLLRLETLMLSEYQKEEILRTTTGYSGEDLLIIDSEASFIYDDEYFESLEFFEFANIQQLELQYFDRILDQRLNVFYAQQSYKVPWKAYIPLLGERLNLPISQMANLRVDISVITERLENSIKMSGDAYFIKLYAMITQQLALRDWRDSINRKLNIVGDLYRVYQGRLDIIHDGILTLVIIILIAVEAVIAFWH
jgi:hypothetical protein